MKKGLTIKDFINAAMFSVLTIAAFWTAGMLGFIPVLMPIVPFACSLAAGPVFMLYSTKIHKYGMLLILGALTAFVFSLSGHGLYVFLGAALCSLLAEEILKKGGYRSIRHARWAYTVFVALTGSIMLPLFIARDAYVQKLIDQNYGEEYARILISVLPYWSFPFIIFGACLGGYLGASLGIRLLKKHFQRAGMV